MPEGGVKPAFRAAPLPIIPQQNLRIDPVISGTRVPIQKQRDLHCAAADLLPNEVLDLALNRRRETFVTADQYFQKSIVDRTDFHPEGRVVLLQAGFAETGHAGKQSSYLRTPNQ